MMCNVIEFFHQGGPFTPLVGLASVLALLALLALLAQQALIHRVRLAGLGPSIIGRLLSLGVLGVVQSLILGAEATAHDPNNMKVNVLAGTLGLAPIALVARVVLPGGERDLEGEPGLVAGIDTSPCWRHVP